MSVPVVLDSNVVISGFLFGGPPAEILELALKGRITCHISPAILDELRGVLQRPKFGLTEAQTLAFIAELHDLCVIVTPTRRVRIIEDDPDDNAILECAEAASASLIVSGDSHLLSLEKWGDIRILSPADALKELR